MTRKEVVETLSLEVMEMNEIVIVFDCLFEWFQRQDRQMSSYSFSCPSATLQQVIDTHQFEWINCLIAFKKEA